MPLLALPVYWHFLSLDAPTVAVLWAWSLARTVRVHPPAAALAILGLGTWLIYVADRLLDGRPGAPQLALRERHFFHARHRRTLLMAGSIAGLALLWLVCADMSATARREDAVLFAIALLYFAVVHSHRLRMRRWFPRELAVGVVFACATSVPAWSRAHAARRELVLPVLLFAVLCCLNCLAIETWERSPDSSRSFPVFTIAVAAIGAAAALTVSSAIRNLAQLPLSEAALFSAMLLLTLHLRYRSFLRRVSDPGARARFLLALRIAADAALLTPLLFVLPWRR